MGGQVEAGVGRSSSEPPLPPPPHWQSEQRGYLEREDTFARLEEHLAELTDENAGLRKDLQVRCSRDGGEQLTDKYAGPGACDDGEGGS